MAFIISKVHHYTDVFWSQRYVLRLGWLCCKTSIGACGKICYTLYMEFEVQGIFFYLEGNLDLDCKGMFDIVHDHDQIPVCVCKYGTFHEWIMCLHHCTKVGESGI